jgi:Lar family restriction alleviation protein
MTALKPCPFCGADAERLTLEADDFGNEGGDVIQCTGCGASSHVEFGRKENWVDAWNRRTPR